MNKIKWVFFDFDGTLVDSIPVLYNIYTEFLKTYNFEGSKIEFNDLNGMSTKELISYLKCKYDIPDSTKFLRDLYTEKIKDMYLNKIVPFSESELVLSYLKKKGYNLLLATSGSEKVVSNLIEKYSWQKYFTHCVFGDNIKKGKPSPEIYNLAYNKIVAKKNEILVVEDSHNGFLSAKAANLECRVIAKTGVSMSQIRSFLK